MADENNEEVLVLRPPGEALDDDGAKPEEIVSLDELTEQQEEQPEDQVVIEPPKKGLDKKKIMIFGGIGLLVLLIIVILLVVLLKKDKSKDGVGELIQRIEERPKTQDFGASKIDDMINKANLLYEKGDKFEALKIYESIAAYNQALSNYNLGVSQMKQENFKDAVSSFAKAIANRENTSVSAINAAVCSLELGDEQQFNYYIDLAHSFLQNETSSPLYHYYYALIHYYKGNYIEALHALKHPSSEYYKDRYDYLAAKILTALGRNEDAIKRLEKQDSLNSNITLAQLYANEAKFDKARDYLAKAVKNTTQPDLIKMTAAIIDLKTGFYADAANFIGEVKDVNVSLPSSIYRIKARLSPELFDVNMAQAHFKDDMFFNKTRRYETLFYFAPYKVFDAKQTMNQIRKGGVSLFLDDTNGASGYLQNSLNVSEVNSKLSSAIAKALNYELKAANAEFSILAQTYPEHSILQYNLALTYAQLGNFSLAAKHFLTSYHLDQNNYLAGIFHIISTDITNSLNPKFIEAISENLESQNNIPNENLYTALLALVNSNQASMIRYLEEQKEDTTLNLAFDIIIAKIAGFDEIMQQKTAKLTQILPKDMVAHILNFIANNKDNGDIKSYAQAIQLYFKSKELDESAFYHGVSIIKKQYINLLQISGLLFYERDKIKERLKSAPMNANLLTTLAYLQIFTNEFDESFKIYNRLIDEFKQDDAVTLFLASVAATGANSPNNAIALLELTNLTDPSAIENRVALGFLYQQIDNLDAAIIQYKKVGNTSHKNEFYDFEIINEPR
ncbi:MULTISPECIES: tetratricopeptide repeat protein [unclassified Campylobacter]|uniref:tetratricopeptide repeat protein n=1 Tax=unclassified Campylobacter TaxID=2593542 RepID=UPI003D3429EA